MSKAFQIKNFPDYYITDTGDVYSRNYNHTGRIKKLKPSKTKISYLRIALCKDNKKKTNLFTELWQKHLYLTPKINR